MSILSKIITTPKCEILVLGGLPEDCVLTKHKYERVHFRYKELDGLWAGYDVPHNWQPVGFLKDVNEDEAEKLVEKITFDKWKHYGDVPDYFEYLFDTAKESLLSLIESEVKLKNKYGDEPIPFVSKKYKRLPPTITSFSEVYIGNDQSILMNYEYVLKSWQSEQSEVFTNPFIMIKK